MGKKIIKGFVFLCIANTKRGLILWFFQFSFNSCFWKRGKLYLQPLTNSASLWVHFRVSLILNQKKKPHKISLETNTKILYVWTLRSKRKKEKKNASPNNSLISSFTSSPPSLHHSNPDSSVLLFTHIWVSQVHPQEALFPGKIATLYSFLYCYGYNSSYTKVSSLIFSTCSKNSWHETLAKGETFVTNRQKKLLEKLEMTHANIPLIRHWESKLGDDSACIKD